MERVVAELRQWLAEHDLPGEVELKLVFPSDVDAFRAQSTVKMELAPHFAQKAVKDADRRLRLYESPLVFEGPARQAR